MGASGAQPRRQLRSHHEQLANQPMSPAVFLMIAVGLSLLGSLVAWLFLRERSESADSMADFRRTMSALDPSAAKKEQDRKSKSGPRRKG